MTSNHLRAAMALLAGVTLGSTAAHATTNTLDFEGLQNAEPVSYYYDGGTGDYGSGPGPNDGVVFDPNIWALTSVAAGGSGYFSGNPSGTNIAFVPYSVSAFIDIAGGLLGRQSFAFSGSAFIVGFFSGLDGTGSLVDVALLPGTADFNTFALEQLNISQYAKSIEFYGNPGSYGFDDLSLSVPEPAIAALLGLGTAGLAAARRRRG